MTPEIGMRFVHKHWTDLDGKPLVYQVTAIREGVVYIRADGERKAKEFVELQKFDRVFCEKADTLPASLAGRCANGYERGGGQLVHAVPHSDDLALNRYVIDRALCGAMPGPRSVGWSYTGMRAVTCAKCMKRMAGR